MRFKLFAICILFICSLSVRSQSIQLKEVTSLPARQIYDALIDTHGFLWVTHELGVSRFDGMAFVNYYNQQQTSLNGTGLIEDPQGRIWLNNFTGQIFYIEHEKMHLLPDYDYKNETTFPRVALYKDQIVATSKKGLFFCDTKTLKCHYVACSNHPGLGTTSLAIMHDKIIAYSPSRWFIYTEKRGLRQVNIVGKDLDYIGGNSSILNKQTFRDTAFLVSNPAGILSKIVADDNQVTIAEKKTYPSFINTVSIGKKDIWVNTTQNSTLLYGHKQVTDYNISSIINDNEGNTWFGTLKKGLFVHYSQADWNKVEVIGAQEDDVIKAIQQKGDQLLMGTQNGKIVSYSSKTGTISTLVTLPLPAAAVNIIYPYAPDKYLIGTSVNSYLFDFKTKKIDPFNVSAIKQVAYTDSTFFIATSNGLFIVPQNYSKRWENDIKSNFAGAILQHTTQPYYFSYKPRSRAVCYDPYSKTLYVSFKDGIYCINKKGVLPFLYKNAPVYAISLLYANGKVIIGTIDNGLIIIDHGNVKSISADQGLSTNAVFEMKAFGDHLWILGAGAIQVINLKTLSLINNYNLPSVSDANIADFEEIKDTAYVTTTTILYKVPMVKPLGIPNFKNYLLSVKLNNQDSVFTGNNTFKWYDNDLQFNLGVPIYHNANFIYFKYRLTGDNNKQWHVTKPGERTITFPSLMPGNYTFEAIAQHPQMGPAKIPVIYKFTILPPWWQSWWFRSFVILLVTAVVVFVVRVYYLNRLHDQKNAYEKELAIQDERHRIASEMHDDVGAGLSAIKLFAGMAQTKADKNNVEVDKIYNMLTDLSDKIREVIWSLNVDNDNLENLLFYIEFQANKIFQYSDISFDTETPDVLPPIVINGIMRRNCYLIIKEALHNALKHSKATKVLLKFEIDDDSLIVYIDDNGIGINNGKSKPDSMGLKSINQRINTLKGRLTIDSTKGTHIIIRIPLSSLKGI